MKKSVFVLLAVFMVLKPMIPIIEYVTNYRYISTVLCENKDKPQMHCKGKCHLKKNLKKTFEEDDSAPTSEKANFLTEWITLYLDNSVDRIEFLADSLQEQLYPASITNLYRYLFSQDLLHPPAAARQPLCA